MNNDLSNPQLNSFVNFLDADVTDELFIKMSEFLACEDSQEKQREVIYDRGELIFVQEGKQTASYTLSASNDRVVHFDGRNVKETNPYAYLDEKTLQMKGDDSSSGGKRRSGSRGGGSSSNNNNNNG